MYFVIDDQSPILRIEEIKMCVDALLAGGHHLIGGDGDWADLLLRTRVLADLIFSESGTA
ncbi:unannotated protein [freshwater metagenome]|uniref:Unannotated protein n=1 Tax=freshwater metagenome TaxID=449393 RepID=A0A6J6EG55_9ZZZZ